MSSDPCFQTLTFNIVNNTEPVRIPKLGSADSAGIDIYPVLPENNVLASGEMILLRTNLSLNIPRGYFGMVASRSGLGIKGLTVAQGIGIIDSDYKEELMIPIRNHSDEDMKIPEDKPIAQLILMSYRPIDEVTFVPELKERTGGFGSSDGNQ